MRVDRLGVKLGQRPSIEDLIILKILKVEPDISSTLETVQQYKLTSSFPLLKQNFDQSGKPAFLIDINIFQESTFGHKSKSNEENIFAHSYIIQQDINKQFQKVAHNLETKLEHRPKISSLIDSNILKETFFIVAPSLSATTEILSRQKMNNNLNHKLVLRPSKVFFERHAYPQKKKRAQLVQLWSN